MIKKMFNIEIKSKSFITKWKKRYRISSIKPSCSKKAAYNPYADWYDRDFLRKMKSASSNYSHHRIYNADETSVRTFAAGINKVYGFTNTGREGRQLKLDMDPKQCITCMTVVTMSGEVLDDYYIKKGKTNRCIKMITDKNIKATTSDNGWMNEDVAIQWIKDVILPHSKGERSVLVWDSYPAHRTPNVRQFMKNNKIEVVYIPVGLTYKRQPLDTHIFSVLKKKYMKFFLDTVFYEEKKITQIDAINFYHEAHQKLESNFIIQAFRQAILNAAESVKSEHEDEMPAALSLKIEKKKEKEQKKLLDASKNEKMDVEIDEEEEEDEDEEPAFEEENEEDEVSDSENEILSTPSHRLHRQAHTDTHETRKAQIYQSKLLKNIY
jgi:hypothetical protein